MKRIPKGLLYDIVAEARKCGVGPRELARVLGYTPEHLSRIARDDMGLPPMPLRHRGRWSELLRELVGRTANIDARVDEDCIATMNLARSNRDAR